MRASFLMIILVVIVIFAVACQTVPNQDQGTTSPGPKAVDGSAGQGNLAAINDTNNIIDNQIVDPKEEVVIGEII